MGAACSCSEDPAKQEQRKEEDRLASQEARSKAAEAAQRRQIYTSLSIRKRNSISLQQGGLHVLNSQPMQRDLRLPLPTKASPLSRQEEFDKSAAGRAARAQHAADAKRSAAATTNKGEPALKVI
ncbi:hypothetical protein Droror1_Dr00013705 [Drosera rotundifolia]